MEIGSSCMAESAQGDPTTAANSPCSYDSPPSASALCTPPAGVGDNSSVVSNDNNNEEKASVVAGARRSVGNAVRRRIRQLYRSFGRADAAAASARNPDGLSASASAAAAVAAAAAAAPTPVERSRPADASAVAAAASSTTSGNNSVSAAGSAGQHLWPPPPPPRRHHLQQQRSDQANRNNDLQGAQPIVLPADASTAAGPAGDKDDDLYTVLTVDAEELKNFYSGIYVVAQCEGKRLKTKRTNKLEDIQTSFIFYRKEPTTKPIEFKMYANHQTLRRRVLIGELSLTLQPGEPFDGMSVRRSIRERPELRAKGGSGLLFNFLSGMLHTQHLSGV